MIRAISYSEGSTLLDCQAKHDFRYGNVLAGSSLSPKETPILLRDGRAWGLGVAAFHVGGRNVGKLAIEGALEQDAEEQREAGLYEATQHQEKKEFLVDLLGHCAELSDPLPIDRLEHELFVPLPSRTGKGDSSRYRLQVFFDGIHVDPAGRTWLVEFKLRTQLSSLELIAKSRQIRYYVWAYRRETGNDVAGVIVDERLKEVPKPARWVRPKRKDEGISVNFEEAAGLGAPASEQEREKSTTGLVRRTVSHAKDQMTTVELYEQACELAEVEPDNEAIEQIKARRWQQRERVFLTDREIEEAGRELVSLGEQVRDADGGRYPVRNPSRARCPGCSFREICNDPHDTELVDALFDRRPAKRDREEIPA